jgi:hypothetical protein
MSKQVHFVIAVEFYENREPEIFIDEGRADALMGKESVWDSEAVEWQSISENEEIFDQATELLKKKFGS